MKISQNSFILCLALCSMTLITTACGLTQTHSESKLINGQQATSSQFPSGLIYMLPSGGRCTGTKVSERHILTAAHCLADSYGRLSPSLVNGAVIKASNFPQRQVGDTSQWFNGRIKKVWLYDQFVTDCATSGGLCGHGTNLGFLPPPDLALIEVNGKLPTQWPSAKIDKTYVWEGDPVVVLGYGCESGTSSSNPGGIVRKKFGRTSVIAGSTINDLKARVSTADMDTFNSTYFMTPGSHYNYQSSTDNVSLCPGDSGGPVYRDSSAEVIVGIHSSYVFFDRSDDISWANRHTRLVDPWAGTAVLGWLESLLTDSSFTETPIAP